MIFTRLQKFTACLLILGCVLAVSKTNCPELSRRLYYRPGASITNLVSPDLGDLLFSRLEIPLVNLGYCLTLAPLVLPDSLSKELELVLEARTEGTEVHLGAAVLTVEQRIAGKVRAAFDRPLAELDFHPGENETAGLVFGQKIMENLRTQYVTQVSVITQPEGARVRAGNGLEGVTPLEWVLPLGHLHLTVVHPGYLTRSLDLNLIRPGEHTVNLPLTRHRFYHSRFFPLASVAAVTALGADMAENYYLNQYHALGIDDQRNRPQRFGQLFGTARTWEKVSASSLGISLISLGLCFRF
jgi:hypothetical protein